MTIRYQDLLHPPGTKGYRLLSGDDAMQVHPLPAA